MPMSRNVAQPGGASVDLSGLTSADAVIEWFSITRIRRAQCRSRVEWQFPGGNQWERKGDE